jgi:hypothetical protein
MSAHTHTRLFLAGLLAFALAPAAAPAAAADDATASAEVLLLGVFHFTNPGLDVVQTEVTNVLTDENQAYLEALTARIAARAPTVVLLEYDRANDVAVNERYRQYLAGEYELGVNEIFQLGFRIARKAGLDRVHSFDEREVHWNAEPLMERLGEMPERKARLDAQMAGVGEEISAMHRTLSLPEVLRRLNGEQFDRWNRSMYIATNDVGAAEGFEGATASASWWHRNFRMYGLLQTHAGEGERVVAIAGQGHTAILRGFLADDPSRVAIDPLDLL